MPRHPRFCPPGVCVHVIQRGNNRQVCFASDGDMKAYAFWLREAASRFNVSIHGWVFMTNHVHLLMTPATEDGISKLMQYLGRHYVRRFNYKYARSGALYEGRFKSCLVQSQFYELACLKYIELYPVRAGMARDPGDYQWSSYRCHAFGANSDLQTPLNSYLALGKDDPSRQTAYRQAINTLTPAELIAKIRHCTDTGLALGSETFRTQIDKLKS